MRTLIVTADDFGADVAVNEAVEQGHRGGILTAASLMVGGKAVADAVARAKALPRLGVGLHLVLVDGRPVLPAADVPDLIDANGDFRANMVRVGIAIATRATVRRQLAAEIEAQFEAFAATGLPLDHVNAHKHFHLHPAIARLILDIGARFGMRSLRAPVEPRGVLATIEPVASGAVTRIAGYWARRARARFVAAGLNIPDAVFGLTWSGCMTRDRFAALIDALPPGLSEIYCHPAISDDWPGHAPGYRYRDELAALMDPHVAEAIQRRGIETSSFAGFAPEA